jgi:SAM-dependent methyltransferase
VTRFPRKPARWPVVVGGGTPYLPPVTEDVPLDLIETRTFGAAVIDSIVWVSSPDCPDFYDAELRAHHEHLRAAYGISPGNEVLDIGCGAGLTTREAAGAAEPGRVVGVDISERMLERAR